MAPIEPLNALLQPPPSAPDPSTLQRAPSSYSSLSTFTLPTGTRTYTQQFSDLYFSRLALLKPPTTSLASSAWADFSLGGTTARRVDRVLDVRQGDLCWVVGTVFMEMPLKPNVLEDVGREHWIAAPVHNRSAKFFNVPSSGEEGGKITAGTGFTDRRVMLEDESGRLRLAGEYLLRNGDGAPLLVTGAIIAVLGTENADGEFEVLDVKLPDLARQPQRWERDDADAVVKKEKVPKRARAGKIAIVSGLGITGDQGDTLRLELLTEWLLGEAGSEDGAKDVAGISRLFILGNSLASGGPIPSREEQASKKPGSGPGGTKKYGYDSSSYNAAPTDTLDAFLADLLPSIPITLLPGDTDPTQAALPQQPLHGALFPRARNYMPAPSDAVEVKGKAPGKTAAVQPRAGWFHSATNPWEGDVDGWRFLATGGQPVEDMCRYVLTDERTDVMESSLRWRIVAPTCPDTLWCYPFQDGDAFVLKATPHVYLAGNQPRFETVVIEGPQGQTVRLVAVPKFRETGEVVLLDAETLETEVVRFEVFGED